MSALISSLTVILLAAFSTAQLLQGQHCKLSGGQTGICKNIHSCKRVVEELHLTRRPTICSFNKNTPIVCCALRIKPGKKAKQMCEKYSTASRERQALPLETHSRWRIPEDVEIFLIRNDIVGGAYTLPKKYPHMAAIGYGDEGSISWMCGGSLISERFVLTAAHCISAGKRGLASWVLLGVLELKTAKETSSAQLFSVVKWIRHPLYKYYSHYHDIGLLKLDREVIMNDYVRPSCLQVSHDIKMQFVVASGWGIVDWADEKGSDYLMDVELPIVSTSKCNKTFRSLVGTRKLLFGVQDDKMLCVGLNSGGKDTCRGDSGGPLQYSLGGPRYMNCVVGVTSFGFTVCGARNSPAVYTRVSYYVPWIEGIVWP